MYDELMAFYDCMSAKFQSAGNHVGYISVDPHRETGNFAIHADSYGKGGRMRHCTFVKLRPELYGMPYEGEGYYFSADAGQMTYAPSVAAPPEWAKFFVVLSYT
jgi:hypothetical protein